MKQLSIIVLSLFMSTALFAQKAKLDDHYKMKKATHAVPATPVSKQVSAKEAMKMDVVQYNRIVNPADVKQTDAKMMTLSKKEHMKREVVKINNRPVQKDSADVAVTSTEKDDHDVVID